MMRPRFTESRDHAAQRGFGACTHVQRIHRHPDGVDPDHRRHSRTKPANSPIAACGQRMSIVTAPRLIDS